MSSNSSFRETRLQPNTHHRPSSNPNTNNISSTTPQDLVHNLDSASQYPSQTTSLPGPYSDLVFHISSAPLPPQPLQTTGLKDSNSSPSHPGIYTPLFSSYSLSPLSPNVQVASIRLGPSVLPVLSLPSSNPNSGFVEFKASSLSDGAKAMLISSSEHLLTPQSKLPLPTSFDNLSHTPGAFLTPEHSQSHVSNLGPVETRNQEAFLGDIEGKEREALFLIFASILGLVKTLSKTLDRHEQDEIRSGSIYVYKHTSFNNHSGTWLDNITWSRRVQYKEGFQIFSSSHLKKYTYSCHFPQSYQSIKIIGYVSNQASSEGEWNRPSDIFTQLDPPSSLLLTSEQIISLIMEAFNSSKKNNLSCEDIYKHYIEGQSICHGGLKASALSVKVSFY